jgi:phosphatidate phosphatase PAH1
MLINQLHRDVDYKSISEIGCHTMKKNSQKDFHFRLSKEEHKLNIRFSGPENIWSPPFHLDRLGKTFVRLSSINSRENQIVYVNIIIRRATFVILLSGDISAPQYIIENHLDIPVIVHQKVNYHI